jgi:hypothetical protein
MARKLVLLAEKTNPLLTVAARTKAEHGPATKILQNIGFQKVADVEDRYDGPMWEWQLELRRARL